jgi:hypothetical protein
MDEPSRLGLACLRALHGKAVHPDLEACAQVDAGLRLVHAAITAEGSAEACPAATTARCRTAGRINVMRLARSLANALHDWITSKMQAFRRAGDVVKLALLFRHACNALDTLTAVAEVRLAPGWSQTLLDKASPALALGSVYVCRPGQRLPRTLIWCVVSVAGSQAVLIDAIHGLPPWDCRAALVHSAFWADELNLDRLVLGWPLPEGAACGSLDSSNARSNSERSEGAAALGSTSALSL